MALSDYLSLLISLNVTLVLQASLLPRFKFRKSIEKRKIKVSNKLLKNRMDTKKSLYLYIDSVSDPGMYALSPGKFTFSHNVTIRKRIN